MQVYDVLTNNDVMVSHLGDQDVHIWDVTCLDPTHICVQACSDARDVAALAGQVK